MDSKQEKCDHAFVKSGESGRINMDTGERWKITEYYCSKCLKQRTTTTDLPRQNFNI